MSMAQKHLHELLKEDQEPFILKNYITDKRCQLKRDSNKTQIQVKKRKPISETSNFSKNLCKNACFFAFQDSPEFRKSPLFEFHSPAKSPCKSPNEIFLKIPARTAALLLEAALKIHKQSSSSASASKRKTQNKNPGFGLFGSILKKLTHRNRNQNHEIDADGVRVVVKDILRWDSSVGQRKFEKSPHEMGFSGACNDRLSNAIWSESNTSKSMDFEASTATSSLYEDLEEINFVSKDIDSEFLSENSFCESPFRFVLQRSPSSGHRTPEFSSPATSPSRQTEESNGAECLKDLQEEEEEEKEQSSPVSVLDPPFEDDDDGHDDDEQDDGFDIECSFAIVQRAKQQLLHKLRRFERLAELDPIELEKRMLEDEADDYESDINEQEEEEEHDCEDNETVSLDRTNNVDWYVQQVLSKSMYHDHMRRIPEDLKRLISDIITEEERHQDIYNDREEMAKRVCKRLESWKEVESNTIDMMVEQDFARESEMWKKNRDQVDETALQIELAIFRLLVEEFSEDIESLTGI